MPKVSEATRKNIKKHVTNVPKKDGGYVYGDPNRQGPWERAGRFLGGAAGAVYGGKGGAIVGEKIGSYLHYIGKIFGSGDYVTSSMVTRRNSLLHSKGFKLDKLSDQIPQFGSGRNIVRIRHREYLGDIISSATAGAFSIQQFPINPGLALSFPWLAQVCGATFQQYRLNGMVFEFRSMSADALNSVNTALGSVVMATDYDSKDSPFTTKQQMENTMFGVSCKPSSCMLHAIECARNQTAVSELYIRAYNVPFGADPRLYDMGNFYIATTGLQGTNVNVGELWVTYDISLMKEIEQVPAYLNQAIHYNLSVTAAAPLAIDTSVNSVQPVFNTFPSSPSITNTVLTLPLSMPTSSVYMLVYALRGTSTASLVPPALTYAGGLALTALFQDGASSGYSAPQAVNTSTTIVLISAFTYNGAGTSAVPPTITFGTAGTYPTGNSGADLWIIQMNGNSK